MVSILRLRTHQLHACSCFPSLWLLARACASTLDDAALIFLCAGLRNKVPGPAPQLRCREQGRPVHQRGCGIVVVEAHKTMRAATPVLGPESWCGGPGQAAAAKTSRPTFDKRCLLVVLHARPLTSVVGAHRARPF